MTRSSGRRDASSARLPGRVAELEARCRAAGVPVTVQRRRIFEALVSRHDHPTADQLLADLREVLPGLSRATVYRSLEALAAVGAVSRACHPGAVVRYDGRTDQHHHLVCLRCGAMADVDDPRLDRLALPSLEGRDFDVTDFRVQLRGVCKDCRSPAPRKEVRARTGPRAPRGRATQGVQR